MTSLHAFATIPRVSTSSLANYLAIDRRIALARGETLPERTYGTALFADISGFTSLAESLAQTLGAARGAEELTRQLNLVYDALIAHVHNYRGSVIGFAGDAMTCFFEEMRDEREKRKENHLSSFLFPLSSLRAVACALAMQNAMRAFPHLAIKIGVATGPARRFVVGDPQIQLIDTLAGKTIETMARAAELAQQGEIILAPTTMQDLGVIASDKAAKQSPTSASEIASDENRPRNDTIAPFTIISELATPVDPTPWDELPDEALSDEQLRPWILPALYERLRAGQEQFSLELRAATALFVQFQEMDYDNDESAGQKLDAYIRHAQRIVNRYEGNIIQLTIGDKGSFFYAVFGAPLAHDDDALHAVQAALELLPPGIASRAAAKQSPTSAVESASSHKSLLAMTTRIGIAAGQMRVGAYGGAARRTYGAIGDATNLAARLMQAAPTGEIRCDDNVYRAASKRLAFETLPPIRVKGKASLIRVYRPTSGQPSAVSGQRPEIIGRRAEIAAIENALDAVQRGATRVLIIEGEAGIGKSRLVDELKRAVRERGLTGLLGNGQSIEQQTPYRAWRDVFNSYFDLDSVKDRETSRKRVESLVQQLIPEHARRLPVLNDVLGLDIPENELTQSLDANLRAQNVMLVLTALLRAWTNERPLVLVLEDAHWLDGLSWQLALYIIRALALANAPLLFVFVNRPLDENSAGQKVFAELRTMTETQSLTLAALAPDEIVALMANRLNVTPDALPAPLVELVQARANGNPFFAEEIVYNLRDTGIITQYATRITLSQDLSQSLPSLPDTLHGLILSRIDRLPPERQFVVKVAAVIGRAFAFTPLHHVINRYVTMVEQSLKAHLAALSQADFTFLEALEPELTYLFKHIITQEAAYQTLLFAQRRELHRHVAEWYENQFKYEGGSMKDGQSILSTSSFILPLLAYHYRCAEDVEKERHYARLAGETAARQYANDAAIGFLSRALDLTPNDDHVARRALLLARESIYHIQGKRQLQIADLEALTALAQTSDASFQAEVALRWARLQIETGDYAAAIQHAQEAIRAAEAAQDQARYVAGKIEWARALSRRAEYASAREHLTQALTLAESEGLRHSQAECLHILGMIASEQGEYALAQSYLERALIIRHELSERRGEGTTLHALGNIAIFQADYARATEYYERAIAIFREIGARAEECNTLNNLGTIALYRGEYAQAEAHYLHALNIAREIGHRRSESNALGNLGIVAHYREEYAQAIAWTEQALAIDRAIGHRQGIGRKLSSLGELARMQGDYARAQECYTQALAIARELGEPRSESIALGNLGLVMLSQQDYARAQEYYTQALAIARQLGDQDRIGYTLTGLGQAHAGLGQFADAISTLQQAIAVRRQVGQLPLLMESLAALARVHLAQGDLAAARQVMQEVCAFVRANSLRGANQPLLIWLTCYQVLAADHDARAEEMLCAAFEQLRARAARIADPATRRAFLENTPWHREIIQAWAQRAHISLDQAMDAVLETEQM